MSIITQPHRCSRCGATIDPDAAEGLCAACVLESVLAGDGEGSAGLGARPVSAQAGPRPCGVLGDYDLVEEIARGGMGVVYRARQRSLDRIVAVKLILVGRWASSQQVARFQGEAALAARLDHPNIVPIFEVGEDQGQHFFSMRLVDGTNLAALSAQSNRRDPLWIRRAGEIVATVASAVHYAHQRGVLHRDLKPSNILIDAQGEPHLTDFGLAKAFERERGTSVSGTILGTPSYMAPEQAGGTGAGLTIAADIYSLGAILYELLTGQPPFSGDSPVAVLEAARARDPESPRRHHPQIPRDLKRVCLKCLRREPEARYGSAGALAEDLRRWLGGEPVIARPVTPGEWLWLWVRRRPVVAGLSAAVIALVLVTAVGASVLSWKLARARDNATRLAAANRSQLAHLNLDNGLRLVKAGEALEALPWLMHALRLDEGNLDQERLHRIRLAAVLRDVPRLERVWFHEGRVTHAAFSPDGRRVATAGDDGKLCVRDAETGGLLFPPVVHEPVLEVDGEVYRVVLFNDLNFSADGRRLVTAWNNFAQVWDATTGAKVGRRLSHKYQLTSASFSPDASRVVTSGDDQTVRLWSVKTGEALAPPLELTARSRFAAFSPDGLQVLALADGGGCRVWEASNGNPMGGPLPVEGEANHAAFSHDGRWLAIGSGANRALLWDTTQGLDRCKILFHVAPVKFVAFNPAGDRLVTAGADGLAKLWDVATGSPATPSLQHRRAVNYAVFSSDGALVATASDDNTARVWDAHSGQAVTPPLPHGGAVARASFSPDGTGLLTACLDGTARLWRLPPRRPPRETFPDNWWFVRPPSFTPDARWALLANPMGEARVFDVGRGRQSSASLPHPSGVPLSALLPDGRRAWTACFDVRYRIWEVATGEAREAPWPGFIGFMAPVFSPDGHRVVVSSPVKGAELRDVATGRVLGTPLRHEAHPSCAAFSRDGQSVVTGARDGTVRVWSALDGSPLSPVLRHDAWLCAVALSDDHQRVATCDEAGTVSAWEVATGRLLGPSSLQPRPARHCRFVPDNGRLITASDDGAVRIWDVGTGQLPVPVMEHTRSILWVVLNPDASRLLTVDERLEIQMWDVGTGQPLTFPPFSPFTWDDTTVRLAASEAGWSWELPTDRRPLAELAREVLLLSGREVDASGYLVPARRDRFRQTWQEVHAGDHQAWLGQGVGGSGLR